MRNIFIHIAFAAVLLAGCKGGEAGKKVEMGPEAVAEAFTRHIAIYLIREMTDMSYPSVGKIFDRNHSTVISSCEIIEKKLSSDPLFLINISDLKKDVEGLDTV